MDPEALRETVAALLGQRLSEAEALRISQAARRMLVAAAPALRHNPETIPTARFSALLRELAADGGGSND